MSKHRYTLLDVFTGTPLQGNPLAVVHDADGLTEETMLAFARETRLSETTFVQRSASSEADYRNRIWMVTGEIPFAGHPSLGTAVAVARAHGVEGQARYVQETRAGRQPVDVRLERGRAYASMLQEPATFGPELDAGEALAAVGLERADADPVLPPQVVSTGVPQILVPVGDAAALERVAGAGPALDALLDAHGALVVYVAACERETGAVRARSWTSSRAVGEDPATGSAAGPLCACLAARTGCARIVIAQGVEMGRPSRIDAALEGDRVRVGGEAVVLVEGTLRL